MEKEIQKNEKNLAEEKLQQEICYDEDEIDLYELWLTIKKRKNVIIGLFLFSVIATAVISFIITPIYRTTASVLPVSASKSPLGSLAGLAAMAGVSVGGDESSQKVMAVLNSRTIKENVIKDLNLIPKLLDEMPEDRNPLLVAIEKMEDDVVSISDDKKTGVINISIDFKDPELAKKIAEQYVKELQDILAEKSLTVSKMNRVFLEKQLEEEEKKLKKYQQEMAEFQKENKIIEPTKQLEGTMELYTNLIAQKIALEVQLKKIETALSPDNPKISILKNQIKEIEEQLRRIEQKADGALPSISNVPEKIVKYTDLLRKLKASEAIYETLLKMYEQAKLDEAKENLYVEVIDYPILPDKPVKPKKKLMVAVAGITSIFLGIFIVFFLEWLENIKKRRELEQT
jgi:uncharacterized protein involved in exopolysaccharide biosynthesis